MPGLCNRGAAKAAYPTTLRLVVKQFLTGSFTSMRLLRSALVR